MFEMDFGKVFTYGGIYKVFERYLLTPSPYVQSLPKVVGMLRKMAANVLFHPFKGLLSKSPGK